MVVTSVLMVRLMLNASTAGAAANGMKQKEQGQYADQNDADDRPLSHLNNHGRMYPVGAAREGDGTCRHNPQRKSEPANHQHRPHV
jgi:hypothetical protein